MSHETPSVVIFNGVKAKVLTAAGPWSSGSDWWNKREHWRREEWDLSLSSDVVIGFYLCSSASSTVGCGWRISNCRSVPTNFDREGWRLAANAIRLVVGEKPPDDRPGNLYFASLYESLAEALAQGGQALFGLEGREHTAQVDQEQREWREWRFRWGKDDREKLLAERDKLRQVGEPTVFLPALFCSPTMELGVDISALNAVYLRNIPPTQQTMHSVPDARGVPDRRR